MTKKKEKEKEPVKPAIQEGSIKSDDEKVVIKLGDVEYSFKRDDWFNIIESKRQEKMDAGVLSTIFRAKPEDFGEWDKSRAFFAKFTVAFREWRNLQKVADFLGIKDELQLRRWLQPRMDRPKWMSNPQGDPEAMMLIDKFSKELFPKAAPKEEKTYNVAKVARLMIKDPGLSIAELAKKMNAKEQEFRLWYSNWLAEINKLMAKLRREGTTREAPPPLRERTWNKP